MLELIIIVVLLALDQISKYLVQLYLSPVGSSAPVINGLLQLTNVHNTGAAWGMLEGFRWRDDGDSRLALVTQNLQNFLDVVRIRMHRYPR